MPASRQEGPDRRRMSPLENHRLPGRKRNLPIRRAARFRGRSRTRAEQRFRIDDARIEVLARHGQQPEWFGTRFETYAATIAGIQIDYDRGEAGLRIQVRAERYAFARTGLDTSTARLAELRVYERLWPVLLCDSSAHYRNLFYSSKGLHATEKRFQKPVLIPYRDCGGFPDWFEILYSGE